MAKVTKKVLNNLWLKLSMWHTAIDIERSYRRKKDADSH